MPIFCFDVKCVCDEKLVPITRYNSASMGPAAEVIALKQMEGNAENGTLWEREANFLHSLWAPGSLCFITRIG